MASSGKLSDRKQPGIKTYCFWIYDGSELIDKSIARDRYREENIICRNCKGCQ